MRKGLQSTRAEDRAGLMDRWWRRERRAGAPPPVTLDADDGVDRHELQRAQQVLEKIVDQARRPVTSAHVTVSTRRPHGAAPLVSGRAVVTVKGDVVAAHAEADNLRTALDMLEGRLRSQLGHRAGRRRDRRRHQEHVASA